MEVRDSAGALANSGAMTLTITLPDGTTATPGPGFTNTVTGMYVPGTYITTQVGRHVIRWVGTGVNAAAYTEAFDVRPALANALISLDDARKQLNIDSRVSDEELRGWIESATEQVEAAKGPVIPRTVIETVTATGGHLWLRTTPVLSVTSATLNGAVVDVSGWSVSSSLAGTVVPATPFALWGTYIVTYRAGRSPIPAAAIGAAKLFVQHSWETQRGPAELPLAESLEGGGSSFRLILQARDLLNAIPSLPGIA